MGFSLYETKKNQNGEGFKRVRPSAIYAAAFMSLILGLVSLNMSDENPFGLVLLVTVFPILLLYPFARWLIGGRDSIAGILLAFILTSLIKSASMNKISKNQRK